MNFFNLYVLFYPVAAACVRFNLCSATALLPAPAASCALLVCEATQLLSSGNLNWTVHFRRRTAMHGCWQDVLLCVSLEGKNLPDVTSGFNCCLCFRDRQQIQRGLQWAGQVPFLRTLRKKSAQSRTCSGGVLRGDAGWWDSPLYSWYCSSGLYQLWTCLSPCQMWSCWSRRTAFICTATPWTTATCSPMCPTGGTCICTAWRRRRLKLFLC